jgi:hypothetical protein
MRKQSLLLLVTLLIFAGLTASVRAQTSSPSVYMSSNVSTGNGTGSGSSGSAVRVQARHQYFANTSVGAMVLAYPSSNTAGNLLVTFASYNRTGPRNPSVSDSRIPGT